MDIGELTVNNYLDIILTLKDILPKYFSMVHDNTLAILDTIYMCRYETMIRSGFVAYRYKNEQDNCFYWYWSISIDQDEERNKHQLKCIENEKQNYNVYTNKLNQLFTDVDFNKDVIFSCVLIEDKLNKFVYPIFNITNKNDEL